MSADEFEIIQRYFTQQATARSDVHLGVGDDAAIVQVANGCDLVLCMDTLVAGVHFPPHTPARAIGHKALAVNLSDLAAMGAEPAWATLSLTLPHSDADWLSEFAAGFFALAEHYRVQLVGGDTVRGPLTVTVQVQGTVPRGQALLRRGAQDGDCIYVTGTLGDAGLALQRPGVEALQARLDYPQVRVEAGMALRGLASAAIDVSDGLLADLAHLLEHDGLGATVEVDALPRSRAFTGTLEQAGGDEAERFYELPLAAGDDYELCFTVAGEYCSVVEQRMQQLGVAVTPVGRIGREPGIRCVRADGSVYRPRATGYRHFGAGPHG